MVKEEKKESSRDIRLIVLNELPTETYREYIDQETSKKVEIITINEALAELVIISRRLDKAL